MKSKEKLRNKVQVIGNLNEDPEELTDLHYHELLDRTYIMISDIENKLINHLASETNKEILDKLEAANNMLSEAYQIIGGVIYHRDKQKLNNT